MNINRELNSLINKNLVKILKLRNFKRLKKDGSYVSKGDIFIQRLVKKFINENYNKNDFLLVSEENFKIKILITKNTEIFLYLIQ